jgi:hypothetical protein
MTSLKSIAHPEWPYTGTPHEWRGFAEKYIYQVIGLPKPELNGREVATIRPVNDPHLAFVRTEPLKDRK